MPEQKPYKIGNYEITGVVGRGAMATVYRGLQTSLNRPVAIKLLSQKVAGNQEIVSRFKLESLIIARLMHPNIVHIIDRGLTKEGWPFFVMNLVKGTTLSKVMLAASPPLSKKCKLILQICKGLAYAHKNGVIHRDIKPANILIDVEGNAILADFGIAQFYNPTGEHQEKTKKGPVLATPSYMSPEQKVGSKEIGATSDLYSLGVIMYEFFTGTQPMGYFKPPSELVEALPKHLDEIVFKCLASNPSDRYQCADEVRDQLLKALKGLHLGKKKKEQALTGIPNLKKRFVLLDVISENRYGAVNLLQDTRDSQLVVVKKSKQSRDWPFEKAKLNTLRHKNIAKVFGSSEEKNHCNIVMEYLSGGSLKDRMVQEHPWPEVVRVAKQICEGLAYAHIHGIIHGNIRPSNILVDESGTEKIVDFGLEPHYHPSGEKRNGYSPEGEKRSNQADIYGVGVILYEMLMAARPIVRAGEVIPHEAFETLPQDLQTLILKMIAQKPEKRYRNLDEALNTIDQLAKMKEETLALHPPPVQAKFQETVEVENEQSARRTALLFTLLLALSLLFYLQFYEAFQALIDPSIR